ncbi:MAG: hypothetical protein ACLRX9_03175 [Streptococcus salivarius]
MVEYQADINYTAVDGERIKNLATIRGDGLNPEDKRNNAKMVSTSKSLVVKVSVTNLAFK